MEAFLNHSCGEIPATFPINLFLEIQRLVMENNVFSFVNTYWLQMSGTAIRMPVTCAHTMITLGH
jgi:hypothetical protein